MTNLQALTFVGLYYTEAQDDATLGEELELYGGDVKAMARDYREMVLDEAEDWSAEIVAMARTLD